VHVEAERAVIELRRPDLDQLGQVRIDVLGRGAGQHHHRLVHLGRNLVQLDAFDPGIGFECLRHDATLSRAPPAALCGVLDASGLRRAAQASTK
jgi:hypothetical protein